MLLVIADIEKGIETRIYLYLQDLRRASHDPGFSEEYMRRVTSEQIGHEVIIGDKKGTHLEAHNLTWQEFLSKQMTHRITFKYTQSAFPPSPEDSIKEEILKIAADTLGAYEFTDFQTVELHDLGNDTTQSVSPTELSDYKSEPSQGRLIHLKFR